MEKLCLDCGQIIKGRSDKKFCDDQCRNNYNNKLKMEDSSVVKQINGILKKNRAILQKLNPDGKLKINKDKLVRLGFNFSYFTHVYETYKGAVYFFCYEYGYLKLENDDLLLVKRNDSE
ncbi:MAG: hypothetical protein EOO43_23320 [Flavobacterium sp.]|nr:MAG: hypothetical protein EOO43_23320 [Flavobacterium sp.]